MAAFFPVDVVVKAVEEATDVFDGYHSKTESVAQLVCQSKNGYVAISRVGYDYTEPSIHFAFSDKHGIASHTAHGTHRYHHIYDAPEEGLWVRKWNVGTTSYKYIMVDDVVSNWFRDMEQYCLNVLHRFRDGHTSNYASCCNVYYGRCDEDASDVLYGAQYCIARYVGGNTQHHWWSEPWWDDESDSGWGSDSDNDDV